MFAIEPIYKSTMNGNYVGKGIGSDALAAVNITAPLFMITTGIGLMFGVGASVVASIHLSQGKRKVASINITQALAFSALLILVLSALCCYFAEPIGRLLGSSERLLPLVVEYMNWYVPLPTNIPSVITNTAEKTIPSTVGINNFLNSLGISIFPKSMLSFIKTMFIFFAAAKIRL